MSRGPAAAGVVSLVVGGLLTVGASGCLLDPHAGYRPARFHAGPSSRTMSVPQSTDGGASGTSSASRTTSPPEASAQRLGATSASMQFTMSSPYWFYAGIEAETGRLNVPGTSNFAGAYGIVGMDQRAGAVSLGAELAAGWQSVRYVAGDVEHRSTVVEPRLRGLLWIAEQWTIGATMGARLGGESGDSEWMAGAYLGVHSHRF